MATAVVGTRVRRLDALDKVTGRARYATELERPGMLQAAVLRSERPHARVLRLDVSRAAALPGVLAVAQGEDLPGRYGELYKEQTGFARERVRYVGEPLAAVAAETRAIAERALELIEVEYEDLPPLFDPLEALKPGAPRLHDDLATYAGPPDPGRTGNVCGRVLFERGDVERALAEAEVVLEETYVTRAVHQSPIEPHGGLAELGEDGRLTVWATTQAPFSLRARLAEALQWPESRIKVVVTAVGGGFGCKIDLSVEHIAAILAIKSGRPVKLIQTREEELAYGTPRHPHRITLTSGVARDGTLLARKALVIQDGGAYSTETPLIAGVAAHLAMGPYRVPHGRVEVVGVLTNHPPNASYRAPGGPQMVFAVESHTDALAERLGMDPLEFRLHNAWQDGDVALNGQVLHDPAVRQALERAAAAIRWGEPRQPNRGKGLACGWWCTTGLPSQAVTRLEADGTLTVVTGASEIGSGSLTAIAQFAADELGIPFEQVRVSVPDTDSAPYDAGAIGSRTTFNQGKAVGLAAIQLRAKMVDLAARLLEVAPDDVELVEGAARVTGAPGRGMSYAALGRAATEQGEPLSGAGEYTAPPVPYDASTVHHCLVPTWDYPSYFCHAAEVEVDPDTGELKILEYVAVHDVGKAVNPTLAEGQVQGGVVQGLGMALTEALLYDDGRLQNRDWSLYKLPTAQEVPPLRVELLEHPEPEGPRGAKGAGEAPIVPPPAAIANAVAAATGVRLRSLPITPEALLDALEGRP